VARRRPWWRFGTTHALKAALLNLVAGFVAVTLAMAFRRADLAAIVTAGIVPPLLVITLFYALRDLMAPGPKTEAPLQAWLALLVSLVPVLLVVVFLMAANPAVPRTLGSPGG
jgi:hypothetical protein